jgi:hypothetical protein
MGRAVAPGALFGRFDVAARILGVSTLQVPARQKIVDLRLLQPVLAAVGDGQGFGSLLLGFLAVALAMSLS